MNLPPNATVDNTMQNHEDKRGRAPTPEAWISGSGILSLEESNLCCSPLFTEAQLQQARADALREAAEHLKWMQEHGEASVSETCIGIAELRRMAAEIEGEKK